MCGMQALQDMLGGFLQDMGGDGTVRRERGVQCTHSVRGLQLVAMRATHEWVRIHQREGAEVLSILQKSLTWRQRLTWRASADVS